MARPRQSRTTPEALDALRERLRATQEAAQRLAEEAAEAAPRVPPAGWDVPGRAEDANAELEALVAMLAAARDLIPPELRGQLAELIRQILVFVRAVVDWWIARVEQGSAERGEDRPVEDIPIG